MNIPQKLKVGGTNYTVQVVDVIAESAGIAGRIDHDKELIRVSKGKQDYMELTFLHEMIHAMNNQWSEEFVEFIAVSLHQVIKDNPELFIIKEVKKDVRRRKKLKKAETLAVLTDAIQVAYVNQFLSKEYASAVFKHNLRELGFDSPKKVLEKPIVVK